MGPTYWASARLDILAGITKYFSPGTDCIITSSAVVEGEPFRLTIPGAIAGHFENTFVSITGQELTPGAYLRLLNYILWGRTESESHDALGWAFTAVTMPHA